MAIEETGEALEEGLKGPAQVFELKRQIVNKIFFQFQGKGTPAGTHKQKGTNRKWLIPLYILVVPPGLEPEFPA
jgi:hypothetical protein